MAILMKYHTLFYSKIKKDVTKLSSAAVMIGALRVKMVNTVRFLLQMSRTSSAPQFSTTNKPEPKPTQTTSVKTETPVAKPISSSTADLIGLGKQNHCKCCIMHLI